MGNDIGLGSGSAMSPKYIHKTDIDDIQCLTIAIVFELFYTKRAMSRVWLTSINIDPKCHSYLVR